MEDTFFAYQRRVLRILLGWGAGSVGVGALLCLLPSAYWRQFGIQALSWGAIDALLALLGRRSAVRNVERLARGELGPPEVQAEVRSFRRILLINAWLDLLYIAAGLFTARRFADRPDRRGLGHGILIQGLFLLLFDSLLARAVRLRWREPDKTL